jgi:hypothetical protein
MVYMTVLTLSTQIGSQLRHHGSRFIPLTSTKNMDNSSDTEKGQLLICSCPITSLLTLILDASEEITQLKTDLAKSQVKPLSFPYLILISNLSWQNAILNLKEKVGTTQAALARFAPPSRPIGTAILTIHIDPKT